ncbi:MAG: hypothetical protein Q8M31_12115 [Beijerinckiaceae bacterium]|nr:hypothetical protein [Beijerinckiaceae bacterium]
MLLRSSLLALSLAATIGAFPAPAQTNLHPKQAAEEAAKVLLRPICQDEAARRQLVDGVIKKGRDYEKKTAKWDLDSTCEQIDLPITPVHDTADEATHTDWVLDARWSSDGKLIVTASGDQTVRIWDAATGRTIRTIDPGKEAQNQGAELIPFARNVARVRAARFLGDGSRIVVSADRHPVRVFDVSSGEPVAEAPYPSMPGATLAPKTEVTAGGLILMHDLGGPLIVHDIATGKPRYGIPGVPREYFTFSVSESADLLAVAQRGAGRSVDLQVRKLTDGSRLWGINLTGGASADSATFSRDGKQLAVVVDGLVHVIDTDTKKTRTSFVAYPAFGCCEVAFSADGSKLITGRRHAELWDISTGKRLRHFGPFTDGVHSLHVSPDGRYLATSHLGSDGRIWEIETGRFLRRLGKNVYPPG